jgi:hypothetical protein
VLVSDCFDFLKGDILRHNGTLKTIDSFIHHPDDEGGLKIKLVNNLSHTVTFEQLNDRFSQNFLVETRGNLSTLSSGMEVVNIGCIMETDETSGNQTKRYNKHESMNFEIANLKKADSVLRFVCTAKDCTWQDVSDVSLDEFAADGILTTGLKAS